MKITTIKAKRIWTTAATVAFVSFLTFQLIAFIFRGAPTANPILSFSGYFFVGSGIGLGIFSLFVGKALSRIEFWGAIVFALIIMGGLSIPYLLGDKPNQAAQGTARKLAAPGR